MGLCAACRSVDFRTLLIACLQQCRDRQEAIGEGCDAPLPSDNSPVFQHHGDIFEIKKSSRDCDLCKVIFQAFERRNVADAEEARGLPIVLRAFDNKIEACYDTEEGLIKLCGLDVYMDEVDASECLRLCKIKESSSPPILKTIGKDPGSMASLAIASGWLRDCLKNHDFCNRSAKFRKRPKRLINVGSENQNPFLVETLTDSQPVEWLSLSYCWGEEPSLKLTEDTMNMLRNGVSLSEFDATIRDAILVTRALKITYIWVDALCIIQGHDAKDWIEQASKMNEIYGGSTVTLVAASSNSVRDGFLKERKLQYVPISSSSNRARESTDTECPARVFLSPEWDRDEDKLNGPWSTRGWTMQEGLLPGRLLHYTSSQLIWKCGQEQKFERGVRDSLNDVMAETLTSSDDLSFGSGWFWKLETFMKFKIFPDYLPSNFDSRTLLEPETFRLWYDLVEEYTQRRFRHISDRLVAISGLAELYGNMIRSHEYVAGLWKQDLIRGLIWHTKGAKLIPRRSTNNMQAVDRTLPSWSWASVGYEIVVNSQKHNSAFQALSRVEDVQIDLVDQGQPFGAVKSGRVTITGPVKKTPRLYNSEWKSVEVSMSDFERRLSEVVEKESPEGVEQRYSSPPGGHFAALQMLRDLHSLNILVLEATSDVSDGVKVYRRVGVLTLLYFPRGSVASADLIARLEKFDTSLTARLGPRSDKGEKQEGSNHVITELRIEPWGVETVVIV